MCRTPTDDAKRIKCGRCGQTANPNDGWEHGWPLYGRIEMGFHSCLGTYLSGGRGVSERHPEVKEVAPQQMVLEWGNGYRFDSRERGFRMCVKCQRELLETIGRFFGIDRRPAWSDFEWFKEDADGSWSHLADDSEAEYEAKVVPAEKAMLAEFRREVDRGRFERENEGRLGPPVEWGVWKERWSPEVWADVE